MSAYLGRQIFPLLLGTLGLLANSKALLVLENYIESDASKQGAKLAH